MKIRGTPSHIAEKYVTMARDALSSGDPVLAENYLQHAEHYNRIIMTYREQQGVHEQAGASAGGRHRHPDYDDDDGRGDELPSRDSSGRSDQPHPGSEPQPSLQSDDDEGHDERPRRRSNPPRDRSPAPAAATADSDRPQERGRGRGRRSRYVQTDDQPEFLKRPVRRPSSKDDDGDDNRVTSDEAAE